MKLVSLNTWGGKIFQPMMDFILAEARSTDVFCFQEVFTNTAGMTEFETDYRADLFDVLRTALPDFVGDFVPGSVGMYLDGRPHPEDIAFGTAIFVRRHHSPTFDREIVLDLPDDSVVGTMHRKKPLQLASLDLDGATLTIANFHGIWIPDMGKGDVPERIKQSKKLVSYLKHRVPFVLCGDLNLDPDTVSVRLLETIGRNLIIEHGITNTRTSFYPKQYSKYADYTFISPGIEEKSFLVPDVEISDHKPMILEFELTTPAGN